MRTLLCNVLSAAAVLLFLASGRAAAQDVPGQLMLHWLSCEDTTEAGEDEIYILVLFKAPDGQVKQVRAPMNGTWDFNDNGPPEVRRQTDVDLWRGTISNSQRVDFFVLFMEEDHVRWDPYVNAFRELLRNGDYLPPDWLTSPAQPPPRLSVGATVWDILRKPVEDALRDQLERAKRYKGNSDDAPGVLFVSLGNVGGQLRSDWRSADRANELPMEAQWLEVAPAGRLFKLTGDGSKYTVVIEARKQP